MRALAVAGAVVGMLIWSSPGRCERRGGDSHCKQIPDICKHLTSKYGERFWTAEHITEVRVPELEPFIPRMLFDLPVVEAGDPKWADKRFNVRSGPGPEDLRGLLYRAL